MFNFFKKKDPIENFWKWFAENKAKFETVPGVDPAPQLDLISAHLNPISDGLSVEVSREFNGVRDIVISPEGDKNKFPIVREIVDKAPPIQGWTVTAFRQRANIDFILDSPQVKYNTAEMFFEPLIDGDEFDLIIYAENLIEVTPEVRFQFGIIVMDNVLGEYDSVMKVRRYDFRDLNEAENRNDLRPLSELPKFVDEFFTRTNN